MVMGLAAQACGVLVPGPGVESSSPASAGGFLTTGPPGKPSRDPELLGVNFRSNFPLKGRSAPGGGAATGQFPYCSPHSISQDDPPLFRFRSGFRLAFRCCPWVTPTEEDKMELTHTPSLSTRVNRCHTREIFFMSGDVAPYEAVNGQAESPQAGVSAEP